MPGKAKPPGPRPELLQHPNVPKPMHGLNPRTVMGDKWWDRVRRQAYARKDFTCWACEVHKSDAKIHQWLEGHEEYEIDYAKGRMVFKRVTALCHLCHSFIHSGRLYALYEKGEFTWSFFRQVIIHGLTVLEKANLTPWFGTLDVALLAAKRERYTGFPVGKLRSLLRKAKVEDEDDGPMASWGKWRLVMEGKEYKPVHANFEAWKRAYGV